MTTIEPRFFSDALPMNTSFFRINRAEALRRVAKQIPNLQSLVILPSKNIFEQLF